MAQDRFCVRRRGMRFGNCPPVRSNGAGSIATFPHAKHIHGQTFSPAPATIRFLRGEIYRPPNAGPPSHGRSSSPLTRQSLSPPPPSVRRFAAPLRQFSRLVPAPFAIGRSHLEFVRRWLR